MGFRGQVGFLIKGLIEESQTLDKLFVVKIKLLLYQ
jgi:hypothetical protein